MTRLRRTIFNVVKRRGLLLRTVLLMVAWVIVNALAYSYAFYVAELKGNVFVVFSVQGMISIPVIILGGIACQRFGRRVTLAICLGMTATCTFGAAAASAFGDNWSGYAVVALITVARIGTDTASVCLYLYTPELFPTPIRNVSIAICSTLARLSCIVSPYVLLLAAAVGEPLCFALLGVAALVGLLSLGPLPETLGHALPDTMDDIEAFGKK